ncbi:response regulator [Pseudobacteriovorax antillogorgiicola]|uniref:Two-component system, chemotaxis family, response regulator CheY n=1 Tax=Pseudobacteriovorax antillogorgiicola TaxID=1513793 RepID=A0A1Y6CLS3_9BACT|nr:response regulator [Pseudobacteriovorax antillogorgiicola]TCS48011.1 two-component system chemotaxis response regulator CheY [Pseudobacteriovorax antillogorgiicola]SMF58555.1 two-component system, chemotaxis family, response regulator CheY [Pseudobacteriovorax antillogorgiicola]
MIAKPFPIAVIDDDETTCHLVLKSLESLTELQVESFVDPTAAMPALMENQFAAVITDINMPQMNGKDMIRELSQSIGGIQFYVITSIKDRDLAQECYRLGARGFLLKPFTNEQVQEIGQEIASNLNRWNELNIAFNLLGGTA